MYVWFWRALPGPLWLRALAAGLVAAVLVLLLMLVVFPWAEPRLPLQQVTVEGPGVTGPPAG